ncbi:MAG: CopG family transcriptional regulator [Deltaproteobacteria bacterium CG_4_8_14_3_um_filter_51_11]|nr:ribbon-helix-helix protein, CopG family [bacterium]OIP38062.1 MAG: CopG family transcriptional regulator [Desulfobacteraceae bacterium CG2_30_51_40]PIP47049.1 MAG: CopG family transcriptional regulator [Deltaproteobacteria bacterium CG23_combo_of_CG06-09_8_20_14_all_51_20]PIV99456.1 MAG: CopG family transcriptional regulator [Deltaproteobacteria bacterium CG17_big_fil_post_rev_8_21_14_2_50_51_6]PIX18673.1 MAG: CopG family transcriptional regulator [Deltaproteobacteria bacterium CG_4_8_14_3_u
MRTIQMTLDDDLVKSVDRVSKELQTTRSAFARKALRDALARYSLEQMERKHRRGYEQHPVAADEFSVWETEQAWGDE